MIRRRRLTVGGLMVLVAACGIVAARLRPPPTTRVVDIKLGAGPAARWGDRVAIRYAGTRSDGARVDSSEDEDLPTTITVGSGSVIRGLRMGVLGMKVGGVRRLVIPPNEAHGAAGGPGIPPNNSCTYDVELLAIR